MAFSLGSILIVSFDITNELNKNRNNTLKIKAFLIAKDPHFYTMRILSRIIISLLKYIQKVNFKISMGENEKKKKKKRELRLPT